MRVPTRSSVLDSILSGRLELGQDHDAMPQLTADHHGSRREKERGSNHEQRATAVSHHQENEKTVTPQGQNSSELQQTKQVTEELSNIPENEDEGEDIDAGGIYDVPSSVLRSIHETLVEEPSSEYDTLIPISSRISRATEENQRTMSSPPGQGFADIKDTIPSAPTATAHMSPHRDHTHSTHPELGDVVASTIKQLPKIEDTPDVESTSDLYDTLDKHFIAAVTRGNKRSQDDPTTEEDNSKVLPVPSSVTSSENGYIEREIPTSSVSKETDRSSETSDSRDLATPEGSEGSDVFIDQPILTMATTNNGKTKSLPPPTQRTQLGGGHPSSARRAATMTAASSRQPRPHMASEPQASPKPRPAKRTRISQSHSQDQPPPQLLQSHPTPPHEKPPMDLPEKPPPTLPEKPPPTLPEKPLPELPDKPPPALPEKPPKALPQKPPLELPDKPPPVLPEKPPPALPEKPLPALPDDPPTELQQRTVPVIPEKPPTESPPRTSPVLPRKPLVDKAPRTPSLSEKPSELHERTSPILPDKPNVPVSGKSFPQQTDRPPKPKPRRNLPPPKQDGSSNSQIEVRSRRSYTTATCLDDSSTPPVTHQGYTANGGSPKAPRSTRVMSSSNVQRHKTGNGSAQHSPESIGTTVYENAVYFHEKPRVAAPPVARKPKHNMTPTSSPGHAFSRREQSKPPTSPKPKHSSYT